MFSKIVLLLAFIASSTATTKKTTKPVAPPTKKPVISPTKKPVAVPSSAPTVYVKTDYSSDYPDLNTFVPISGTDGMYTHLYFNNNNINIWLFM